MPKADVRAAANPRTAGLVAFNRERKRSSRESLLAAAVKLFCQHGYAAVAIEDITAAAGVSRVTFYRHFPSKSAIALELFRRAADEGVPRVLAIGSLDFRRRDTVIQWLHDFFAGDRDMKGILRVLSQANVEDADFAGEIQPFIAELIAELGTTIPAFRLDPDRPSQRRRWVEAWLVLYTILDQSNQAATKSGIATDPFMIDVLADKFVRFVIEGDAV